MRYKKSVIAVFILPAVLFFCLIFLYPIIRTGVMSFYDVENLTSGISEWLFSGFDNYKKLGNTSLFRISMWNLFRIWAVGGIVVMLLALLFAVILNNDIKGKKFFRAVIYMPNIISAVALATMWLQYVYNPRFGLLTTFFNDLGLTAIAKTQWTAPNNKFWAMLFAYCFGMVGYHMLIFSSGIEKIPSELYEAASIDGASIPAQFKNITLPLLKGVVKTNLTMWSITSVSFFTWSQLFSSVLSDVDTISPVVYLYNQVFSGGNVVTERNAGIGAAVGILMGLCVVLVFLIINVLIRDDDFEF
ncbi:MAG: carbohydrate ABC transporter permease [Christensenellales bacterium]|jgi:ABC-type sugar transport system permease subunit